ncbi:MAG: DivIVA domain-containing protein [Candidatus Krumholzibacteriota bacterium]|nr:DivIVA domain-containing protein [Candidatus Krumholzibacteriota bacterium]
MRITPLDVRKQQFRKAMRGLDAEEVYAFLSTVADEYEAVLSDNKALRERLLELDDKVQEYRSLEKTLRNTLLTAERVTVEAKDNARREAMIIVKEAQMEAEKALRDIKTEATTLRQQAQQLRAQRDAYLAKMRVVTESHLSFVEATQSDFQVEDRMLADLGVSGRAPAPVRHAQDTVSQRTPEKKTLFDAPPKDASAIAVGTAPPDPSGVDTPPQATRPPSGHGPNHASAALGSAPDIAAVPDASATNASASGTAGDVADIAAIIDHMALNPAEGSLPPAPTIEATTTLGTPPLPGAEPERGSSPRIATATAEAPQTPPIGHDVTGEWNIDQIRRDILGRGPAKDE